MSALDDLNAALLAERYDNRWWTPSAETAALIADDNRRSRQATADAEDLAAAGVVTEIGRGAA